ncbi:MAG: response regulator [Phascolarctobacterium sp.]
MLKKNRIIHNRIMVLVALCCWLTSWAWSWGQDAVALAAEQNSAPKTAQATKVTPVRKVRVGFFEFPGYHELQEKSLGSFDTGSGYGCDFLFLLRRYANLNYEFVGYDKSWQEMLSMLRRGEIDMVTSATKNQERLQEFAYSAPIGKSFAVIAVRKDDERFSYSNYKGFQGMRLGALVGNSRNKDLATFALDRGFTYSLQLYHTVDELEAALYGGQVDGIISSNLRKHDKEKIVASFAPRDFYVIVRKDNQQLLEEIDYGIKQMDLHEGDWRNALQYKYYGTLVKGLVFSEREQAYIAAVQAGHKKIIATAQPDRDPYSFVKQGKLVGIIPEYFAYLMEKAGLPYEVIIAKNRQEYEKWTMSHEVDVFMDARLMSEHAPLAEFFGVVTKPFMQLTMARVTRRDFQGQIRRVAVAENQGIKNIDAEITGGAEQVFYATRRQALEAVKSGQADACYVYTYMAEKFVNEDEDKATTLHILNEPVYPLRVYVSKNTDHELASILSKCIKEDKSRRLDELVEKYTTYNKKISLMGFVRQNPWFFVALLTLFMGAAAVVLLVIYNNRTTRKMAAEQQQLAARLQEKNEQLERSIKLEQQANKARREFLCNMSHDIRTPMNAIIGFTDIAKQQTKEAETSSSLEKIRSSSEHLLDLINNVLDISRIESGEVEYKPVPVDLRAVTASVLNIMNGYLANRDLQFEVQQAELAAEHRWVLTDGVRLREILVNILGNAVKFTKDGGRIAFKEEVSLAVEAQQLLVRYSISDTGVGMSAGFLVHIFEEFAQEQANARTEYRGSGLGMAITKRYVEMLGGTIEVASTKGEGSSFVVELPLSLVPDKDQAQEQRPESAGSASLQGVQVLLVEDNDLNAEIATIQLEKEGLVVTRAANGREAVELFKKEPAGRFQVILMDIMMPEMDGYEATRALRSLPERPDGARIPIIAMTANAFVEDVEAALAAGMNAHLAKPIVMEEVLRTLRSCLQTK